MHLTHALGVMARYALVVGIDNYICPHLKNLSKPQQDAEAIAEKLEKYGQCEKVTLLKGNVSTEELNTALLTLIKHQAIKNEAIIYFAGHGVEIEVGLEQKEGYLATSDFELEIKNKKHINPKGGIKFPVFNNLIQESDLSNLVVLIDACHSGKFIGEGLVQQSFTAFTRKQDYYILTACRGHASAFAARNDKHSIFTGAVLEALTPEKADSEGRVTVPSLFSYLGTALRGGPQEPVYFGKGRLISIVQFRDFVSSDFLSLNLPVPQKLDATLIEGLKCHCRDEIMRKYSKIRILGGEEIDIGRLYVDVWLLDSPEKKLLKSPNNVLESLSKNRNKSDQDEPIKRDFGRDIAKKKNKLVILGKPGSGKTTFLKYLALLWCEKKYKEDSIAVFLELRDNTDSSIDLIDEIDKKLGLGNYFHLKKAKAKIQKFKREQNRSGDQRILLENRVKEDREKLAKIEIKIKSIRENIHADYQKIKPSLDLIQAQKIKLQAHRNKIFQVHENLKAQGKIEGTKKKQFEEALKKTNSAQDKIKSEEKRIRGPIEELKRTHDDLDSQRVKIQEFIRNRVENIENLLHSEQIEELKKYIESLPLQLLLRQGKLLVFIDGLDELTTKDLRQKLQRQLSETAEIFPDNSFILTCRTQVMETIPKGFETLEVDGFKEDQIEKFTKNWFSANPLKGTTPEKQWEIFKSVLESKPSLREIATTPVLLNLICLAIKDNEEIPSDKVWLYGYGVGVLLEKWNSERNIPGKEIYSESYRNLNAKERENLLIDIAYRKINNSRNSVLFEEDEIAQQISEYLGLDDLLEGTSVLKEIEAQHGLLVERADGLWSFSHLTFQEYFVFRKLLRISQKELYGKLTNQRWKNIIRQLVVSQQPADELLVKILNAIQKSITYHSSVEEILEWVYHKSASTHLTDKFEAARAFYYHLYLDLAPDGTHARARIRSAAHHLDIDPTFEITHNSNYKKEVNSLHKKHSADLESELARTLKPDLYSVAQHTFLFEHSLRCCLERMIAIGVNRTFDHPLNHALSKLLERAFENVLELNKDPNLEIKIEEIRAEMPRISEPGFHDKWQEKGSSLVERLRQLIISRRNICHNWEMTRAQKKQIKNYYYSNQLLVNMMGVEDAVTNNLREKIENCLFLTHEEFEEFEEFEGFEESEEFEESDSKI